MVKKDNSSKRFVEECPKKRNIFPKNPCNWGRNRAFTNNKNKKDPICPWYINDEESNYCFWVYINNKKNSIDHTLEEIAELTNTSINNIKLAETSGLKRVLRFIRNNALLKLFQKV